MKKKILSLALALSLVWALVPFAAPVAAADDGKFLMAIAPPEAGSIPISNRTELAAIKDNLSGKYHLVADLDLSDGAWIPIGNSFWGDLRFRGIFDGQGHVISGLTVIEGWDGGLFGCAGSNAIIKNIGVIATNVKVVEDGHSDTCVGAICGVNEGEIYNCFSSGSVSCTKGDNGSVYNSDAYTGGICGKNKGSVSNCFNSASIFSSTLSSSYAGGICGINTADASINNCYNIGPVNANTSKDSFYMGGICGYSENNATVKNSCWYIDSPQTANVAPLSNDEKKGLGYGMGQTTALTSAQMKTQASYSGWDFTKTWTFVPGENNDYPVLRTFYDLPSSWAEYSVNQAIRANLVPKALQGKYTADITRAEFCALAVAVYETYTGTAITTQKTFTDTTDPNVQKMAGLGVVTGGGDGTFNPGGTFNREMAAVLLVNLLDAMNIKLDKAGVAFTDKADIAFWALEQVGQAQAAGLVSGSDGKYNPKGKFTRESGIMLMLNLCDYLKK